ncbi:MAG: MotA/TolQ/ExbB proton channel family protein [Bacteroidota bacterium]
MEQKKSSQSTASTVFTYAVIPVSLLICIAIYKLIMGNPANFIENNPDNNPLPGNYLGIVYKGGVIVPILMSTFLIAFTFCLERFVTISRTRGKKNVDQFLNDIRGMVNSGNIDQAINACKVQKGSIGNVIQAGLVSLQQVSKDSTLDKEQKVATIQKSIEEATSLELPMLSKNLSIISTIASTATLIGLLGTVLGMIKAFAAMATAGAPDAVALANGIAEALINTALGVGTSTIAIIMYNYFTTKIDAITYGIDEAGYSIIQGFSSKN